MNRNRGFTLLELMIVVVIVAILSTIAITSYRHYILRAHRTDATRTLLELAGRQERFFYSHNAYASDLADLGASSSVAGEYFSVAIANASSTDYLMTATAVGTQTQDDACRSMSLSRDGQQTSTGTQANDPKCWGQ